MFERSARAILGKVVSGEVDHVPERTPVPSFSVEDCANPALLFPRRDRLTRPIAVTQTARRSGQTRRKTGTQSHGSKASYAMIAGLHAFSVPHGRSG